MQRRCPFRSTCKATSYGRDPSRPAPVIVIVQGNRHVSTKLPLLQHGINTIEKRLAFHGFGLDADVVLLAMRKGTVRIGALALGEGLHGLFCSSEGLSWDSALGP